MFEQKDEGVTFRVVCPNADAVHLLLGTNQVLHRQINMRRTTAEWWEASLVLPPNTYQCRYYAKIGRVLICLSPVATGGAGDGVRRELETEVVVRDSRGVSMSLKKAVVGAAGADRYA